MLGPYRILITGPDHPLAKKFTRRLSLFLSNIGDEEYTITTYLTDSGYMNNHVCLYFGPAPHTLEVRDQPMNLMDALTKLGLEKEEFRIINRDSDPRLVAEWIHNLAIDSEMPELGSKCASAQASDYVMVDDGVPSLEEVIDNVVDESIPPKYCRDVTFGSNNEVKMFNKHFLKFLATPKKVEFSIKDTMHAYYAIEERKMYMLDNAFTEIIVDRDCHYDNEDVKKIFRILP